MTIHVVRNGQEIGQFTSEQVEEGIKSGSLLANDYGWHEMLTEWVPLVEIYREIRKTKLVSPEETFRRTISIKLKRGRRARALD